MRFLSVAATLALMPSVAHAQTIQASDPQGVVRALQADGYKAQLTKDEDGNPLIDSATSGVKFKIFFFGCTNGSACTELQFWTGFTEKVTPEQVNKWNRTHRFGRAYVDDSKEINMEYDINTEKGGLSPAMFTNDLELWDSLIGSLRKFLKEL